MKLIVFVYFLIIYCNDLYAQANTEKKDSCICEFKIPMPGDPGVDTVSATVIVEFKISADCIYSDPVIVQGGSAERNAIVLQFAQRYIAAANKCRLKCNFSNCAATKKRLPLTFKVEEE